MKADDVDSAWDSLGELFEPVFTTDPTDVPVEQDGTTIVLRGRFSLTLCWRDGGAGAPVMISF